MHQYAWLELEGDIAATMRPHSLPVDPRLRFPIARAYYQEHPLALAGPGRRREADALAAGQHRHRQPQRLRRPLPTFPGIIWPAAIAPFEVVICPVNYRQSETVRHAADQLFESLVAQGIDTMLDDRGERPGAMFADWELIGVPHRITVGERGLKEGKVEHVERRSLQTTLVPLGEAAAFLAARRNS